MAMNKEYSVGKAQKMVLDALGMEAESHAEAEKIFADLHIVVIAVRQGRTSVPHVGLTTRGMAGDDGYDRKLVALVQWMDEPTAKMFAQPENPSEQQQQAQVDVRTYKYHNLIPGQLSPEEFAVSTRFWNDIFADYPQFTASERQLYRRAWLDEYQKQWNAYWS